MKLFFAYPVFFYYLCELRIRNAVIFVATIVKKLKYNNIHNI